MQRIGAHLRNLDWVLLGSALGLTAAGIVSVWSSSVARNDFSNLEKQIMFFGIGFFAMILISFVDYRLIRNDPYFILLLYAVGVAALAGLFLFAPEIRGTKGWYRIWGVSIDPIEYMKVVLIIIMAKYFALRHIEVYRFRHIVFTGIYFLVPMFLIVLQPDLGPIFVLGILWSVLLLIAGIRIRHLLAIIGVGVIIFSLGWSVFLLDYQKDRILGFIEPEFDPLGIGWSQLQSEIAVGNGGIFGQGFARGTQTQYGFLSEPQTDFIFAAIAEEFGLLGILGIFALFSFLIWRIMKVGIGAQDNFAKLYSAGLATVFIAQIFVNVGMNLGLLPIIGLALPFVSYGGSSLIAIYVGLGIVMSIKVHSS